MLPTTKLIFLGLELDSEKMEIRLPLDKLEKVLNLLGYFSNKKKVTLLELQSFIGLLNFACYVVPPGRSFLRRLINLTKGIRRPHFKIRLNKEAKSDLKAWALFVDHFNGKGLIVQHKFETSQSLHMYTDASNLGFGGFLGTHWFYHGWTDSWLKLHISIREFYPIVLAVELWSQILRNKHVQFHCDNIAVVHCINKQTAKDVQLMALVRRLVVQALKYNIFFEAKHIPGLKNILADKLSRFQVSDFKRLAPEMDQTPTDVSHLMKDL